MNKRKLDIFVLLIFIVLWWIGSLFTEEYLLPPPYYVLFTISGMLNWDLLLSIYYSFSRLLFAYFIAILISVFLAVIAQRNDILNYLVESILSHLLKIPNVGYLTFFLLFIGIGTPTIITTIVVSSVPVITMALLGVLRQSNRHLLEISEIFNVNFKNRSFYFYLPTIFDGFYPIFSMSFSFSFKVLIMSEFIAGMNGLGYRLVEKKAEFSMDSVIAYIIIIVVAGIVFQKIIEYIFLRIKKWM